MAALSTRDAARQFAQLGLNVMQVPAPRAGVPEGQPGDGKVPALPWKELQGRLSTPDEHDRWFATDTNIAIICGAISGIVAVDCDSKAALKWATTRLPYTPWQQKTSSGYHLIYRHPGMTVTNRARIETTDGKLKLDVRGDGGYIIAAPSLHRSGVRYRLTGDWSVSPSDVPRFWPGWLARPARPAQYRLATGSQTVTLTGDLVSRGRRYLAKIPPPVIGHGSDNATLFAACKLVRGLGLSEGDTVALLWEWAGGRPGWSEEWIATKVAHAVRYGTEPIGAMR